MPSVTGSFRAENLGGLPRRESLVGHGDAERLARERTDGDARALGRLVERQGSLVYRVLRALPADPINVEDAFQKEPHRGG
jgi:hypothetical protein